MRGTFLAFVVKSQSDDRPLSQPGSCPPGLAEIYNHNGLILFADPATPCLISENNGLILGKVFSADLPSQVMAHRRIFEPLSRSQRPERYLIKHFWGGYLAFLGGLGTPLSVLRDPSGTLPCYYREFPDWIVLWSDMDTFISSGFEVPEVDWTYLTRHFLAYDLRSPETALKGIKELLPGFALQFSADKPSPEPIWNPWDHTREDLTSGPELPAMLRETVLNTIGMWTSPSEPILLSLSGGLDSSILAAALKANGANFQCLNMATEQAQGDEREYARKLVRHLDVPLHERFHALSDVDITRTTTDHLPRPIGHAFSQSKTRIVTDITAQIGAVSHFNGIGGDNVFCGMQSATPILDRFLSHGLSPETLGTFRDICDLTGCSWLDALKMAFARASRVSPHYNWRIETAYLAKDAVDAAKLDFSHAWLDAPIGALPGKAVHISLLLRVLSTLSSQPHSERAPPFSPLLSQPIMELCLRIPTWRWVQGGVNRALAREAFAAHLPSELINRQSKGSPTGFVYDVISTNRGHLRNFLLDGALAGAGLLDTRAIEAELHPSNAIRPPAYSRISQLAEGEAWARHWISRARSQSLAG